MTKPTAPTPTIETLDNGMSAVFLPSDANNIVGLTCFIPLPGAIETLPEAGLVSFTHRMLLRGTRTRGNAELAEAIESLGTSLSSEGSDDFSVAHVVCTNDTFTESVRLLADVLQHPAFEPEEIEKERQSTIAAIRRSDDEKFSFTYRHFLRTLYDGHSYGLPRLGYVESVSEFKREQLLQLHTEFFDPARFLVVCVGNFSPEEARELLVSSFRPATAPSEPFSVAVPPRTPPGRQRLSRDCEQAFLTMGCQTCSILSPDFPAVRLLNAVLGEGMSSRLFVHLRDEKGLAYATGSLVSAEQKGGHLVGYIGTKPESLDMAREGMLAEFEQIKRELVGSEEFERARNYVIGKFLIDHQTNYKRAYYLGYYQTIGLGMAMDEEYPKRLGAVTTQQVLEAANKYLTEPTIVELMPGGSSGPGQE